MNIIENGPLRAYSHNLWGFSLLLRHNDTFPFIRGYEFTYEGDTTPSLETLQKLLPNKNIAGTITSAPFSDVQKLVHEACSWYMLSDGTKVQSTNTDTIWSREKIFWSNLDRYQTLPADNCFIHHPAPGSFFAETTLWSFCFIVTKKVTDTVSHGLLIYGKTWNSPAECPAESDYEALWRKNNFMD